MNKLADKSDEKLVKNCPKPFNQVRVVVETAKLHEASTFTGQLL